MVFLGFCFESVWWWVAFGRGLFGLFRGGLGIWFLIRVVILFVGFVVCLFFCVCVVVWDFGWGCVWVGWGWCLCLWWVWVLVSLCLVVFTWFDVCWFGCYLGGWVLGWICVLGILGMVGARVFVNNYFLLVITRYLVVLLVVGLIGLGLGLVADVVRFGWVFVDYRFVW